MKDIQQKSLGVLYPLKNVPETVAEFDTNAGKEGAALAAAVDHVVQHSANGVFRAKFLEKVAEDTKLPRRTETTKNDATGKETTVFTESEGKYFARVLAQLGRKSEDFQALASTVEVPFEASATERGPAKPKTPGRNYLEAAAGAIASGTAAKIATKLAKKLGKEVDGADATALAWAIREWDEREQAQRLASLVG